MYPAYVDDGPLLFTGFSQGAIMGASIMARHPDRYPRAVLIEGGQKAWYAASAKAFSEGGGQRILFACGQWDCNRQSTDAGRVLEKHGVASRVVFRKGEGHSYGGGVAEEIASAFDWVIEGDARWTHRGKR
jgi:predicted esterase